MSFSHVHYECCFPLIKLYVILPFSYCYCLRVLSPLPRVECWLRGGRVRSCVFLSRGDWVMMLDGGTVSVLWASCNSTEGWEKYKRSGAVASLEILLHPIYSLRQPPHIFEKNFSLQPSISIKTSSKRSLHLGLQSHQLESRFA